MSHLRPINADTGRVKDYREYSPDERVSAITQIEDASKTRAASAETVALAQRMLVGNGEKADRVLDGRELDINTAPVTASASLGVRK